MKTQNKYYKVIVTFHFYANGGNGSEELRFIRHSYEEAMKIYKIAIKAYEENERLISEQNSFNNTEQITKMANSEGEGFPNGSPKFYEVIETQIINP